MNVQKILEAKVEARRFLNAVKKLADHLATDPKNTVGSDGYLFHSKHAAAVRRASMDLTRALAEMRKS